MLLIIQAFAASPPAPPAPTPEALLHAGACRDEGPVKYVIADPLPTGRVVWLVQCAYWAYQGTYQLWWNDAPGLRPALMIGELPRTLIGNPGVEDGTSTVTNLQKSRGPGDCGEWFRFVLAGDRFEQQEHRERSCSDEFIDPMPQPETWSPAIEPCAAHDQSVFRCSTAAGKEIVLCGSSGRLQYRFGVLGKPELVFPADASPDRFTWAADRLSFDNGGFRYEVGPLASGTGIRVSRGAEGVATIACTGDEPVDMKWLGGVVGRR